MNSTNISTLAPNNNPKKPPISPTKVFITSLALNYAVHVGETGVQNHYIFGL